MAGQDGCMNYLAGIQLPVTFIVFAPLLLFAAFMHFIFLFYNVSVQKKKGFFLGDRILSLFSQGMSLI